MLSWMRDKFNISRQKFGRVLFRRSTHDYEISQESSYSNIQQKMLVEDTNPFPDDKIKLHIIGLNGSVWTISVPPDISIATLKSMVLCHFFNPIESTKLQQNYKLVVVSTKRVLQSDSSIQDEELGHEEEILLAERRVNDPKDSVNNDELQKGPTQKEILAATSNLTPTNIVRMPPPLDCSEDVRITTYTPNVIEFQTEFRKILISLIEISAQLLTTRPNANEIFASILERLETRDKIVPDRNSIRNIMEMGFSEEKVILALRLKRNNPNEALEWLLENGINKVEDVTETKDDQENNSSSGVPTVLESVSKLLASFRSFRRKEFRPNAKILQELLDMGFEQTKVIEALRVTGNNQASACEWLLGERSETFQDLDTGLDPEGPIFKALLANPTIQLGLNNPRMLLAFLSILENPQSANNWLHDSEAAPILNQIFKTYHAEKHILGVNRHMEIYTRAS